MTKTNLKQLKETILVIAILFVFLFFDYIVKIIKM